MTLRKGKPRTNNERRKRHIKKYGNLKNFPIKRRGKGGKKLAGSK